MSPNVGLKDLHGSVEVEGHVLYDPLHRLSELRRVAQHRERVEAVNQR